MVSRALAHRTNSHLLFTSLHFVEIPTNVWISSLTNPKGQPSCLLLFFYVTDYPPHQYSWKPVWRQLSSSGEALVSLFAGVRSTLICESGVRQQRHTEYTRCSPGWGTDSCFAGNSNNDKITFLPSLSHTKRQIFFPPFAPSSFFLLPSAAHNSEHYDYGCPEALEWIQWAGQDSTPSEHYLSALAFNCQTGKEEDASTPFLFFRQEAKWLRVFPSTVS